MLKELEERLPKEVVHFVYKSSKGTRIAIGTKNPDLIPKYNEAHVASLIEKSRDFTVAASTDTLIESYVTDVAIAVAKFAPKDKKERKVSDAIVTYYDFTVAGWRSFKKDSLMSVTGGADV